MLEEFVVDELVDDPVTHVRVVRGDADEDGLDNSGFDFYELDQVCEVLLDLVDGLGLVGNHLERLREVTGADLRHHFGSCLLLLVEDDSVVVAYSLRAVVACQ